LVKIIEIGFHGYHGFHGLHIPGSKARAASTWAAKDKVALA
jgi:hypothetical protein